MRQLQLRPSGCWHKCPNCGSHTATSTVLAGLASSQRNALPAPHVPLWQDTGSGICTCGIVQPSKITGLLKSSSLEPTVKQLAHVWRNIPEHMHSRTCPSDNIQDCSDIFRSVQHATIPCLIYSFAILCIKAPHPRVLPFDSLNPEHPYPDPRATHTPCRTRGGVGQNKATEPSRASCRRAHF